MATNVFISERFTGFRLRVGALRSRLLAHSLPILPRAVWRLLPGTSAAFGPPRRWQSWPAYARRHGTSWIRVLPARSGDVAAPFWLPADGRLPFAGGSHFDWPEQGIARLDHARVISMHGWCVAPRDTFLGDFCFGGNRRTSFVYSLTVHHRPRPLAGVTLNLCSAHGATNFCHWLIDCVARLELFERAGMSLGSVDHVLLPAFPGATAAWVLASLGLPGEKLIHPAPRDQFLCETLLQPSYPGVLGYYPPWVAEFYRRRFPAPEVARHRRVYLLRRGKRGLLNAPEVEAELVRAGFEAFDPAGQTDLHVKLADVSHVIGVHGAALANLVFCRPGTRVLELLPSDLRAPYYYSLCGSAGMPYGVIVGKSTRERRREDIDLPTHSPFQVRLDELAAAVAALVAQGSDARRVAEVGA